jgi:hypothetical protein
MSVLTIFLEAGPVFMGSAVYRAEPVKATLKNGAGRSEASTRIRQDRPARHPVPVQRPAQPRASSSRGRSP